MLLFCVLISMYSCKKSDDEIVESNIQFNHKILEGYNIGTIAFDHDGTAWIGTLNQGLIRYNTQETVIYNYLNSILPRSPLIIDIAISRKNDIWFSGKYLYHFDGANFTEYTPSNSELPVDINPSIAIDSKDNVWLSSSIYNMGGLVKIKGNNWTIYTPDSSGIPVNGITSVAIDQDDAVWLAQYSDADGSFLTKFNNQTWTVYSKDELGFAPFMIREIKINSKNEVCGSIDYVFSQSEINPGPQCFIFDGENARQLKFDDTSNILQIIVDHKDHIWGFGLHQVAMFDGTNWTVDSTTFKNTIITSIAQSHDNKIWIGTTDGIYIND